MRRAIGLAPDRMVLKSLAVRRSTSYLIMACTAGSTVNAALVLRSLELPGQVATLGLLFSFTCLAGAMMSKDIVERSGSVMATLRSVGATRPVIATTLTLTLTTFGGAGAAFGAGLGTALGAIVGSPAPFLSIFGELTAAFCVSSAAAGIGVYSGVVLAWRK